MSVLRAFVHGYWLSEKTIDKGLKSLYRKKSSYQKKKPPGYVPVKQRKYFCVFQTGGPIWGIGCSKKEAIFDSYGYIEEDEFELHDAEDYAHCPDGDFVVMRCSSAIYGMVEEKGSGEVRYYVCNHHDFYQVRKMICQDGG